MDLSEKDKIGLGKRNGDHINNYHTSSNLSSEWQFSNQSIDSFANQSTNPHNPILNPLTVGWNTGIFPHFPIDSGFIERAARFSSFGGGNFYSASEPLSPYGSGETEFSGDGQEEAPNSSDKGNGATKRKRSNQKIELDIATKEIMDTKQKGQQSNSTAVAVKPSGKNAKDGSDGLKEDYIHVRARRGQATSSHSLAERVRREKISERMKYLQELVPGCSKVTGKAVMLDEIINYVQSLQRQVEFLSMKLATVNPRLDFNIEELLSKDIFHLRDVPSSTIGFSPDMVHPQLHPSQQSWIQSGIPGMTNPSDVLRRAVNAQMANEWDGEFHNTVQMTFGANTFMNTPEAIGKPRDGFPL